MADADVSELLTAMHRIDVLRLSEEHKHELKVATSALSLALETPWEITMRIFWQEPSVHACICTLIDLDVFKRWVAECEEVRSYQQLAELVGCDSLLMNRLLRNLASNGLLVNCGSQDYAMTEFTRSLAQTKHIAAFSYFRNLHLPMLTALPTYLASTKYQDSFLKHPTSTAFNQALGTKDGLFDYLSKHPDQERDFGHCMEAVSGSVPSWIEIYPTESSLVKSDGQRDDVVVVDVGGSISHDLNAFQRKHRLQPGRLVLQDLAEVLEGARVESGITKMPHDFFTDQTVEGKFHPYIVIYSQQVRSAWDD
ncbi:S-adenosyl-L-methionine-dependent methyltransferase, partial [Aureobasidium melanogenum]